MYLLRLKQEESMKLNIQKWGNSAAVRLPSAMLAQLGVKIGDAFTVDVSAQQAVLRAAKPHYTLDELLAQCNPAAELTTQEREWLDAPPVGNEAV